MGAARGLPGGMYSRLQWLGSASSDGGEGIGGVFVGCSWRLALLLHGFNAMLEWTIASTFGGGRYSRAGIFNG